MLVERRRPGSARNRRWIEWGIALFVAAYVLQATFSHGWGPLRDLQATPGWRLASGLGVAAVIAWMWVQSVVRSWTGPRSAAWLLLHRLGGMAAVSALFLHTARWGHGYLTGLAMVFLGTAMVGILSPAALRIRSPVYQRLWLVLHVVLALVLVAGVAFHVWVGLSYV